MLNLSIDNETVRKTNVTDIASRFDLEWKNFSQKLKAYPKTAITKTANIKNVIPLIETTPPNKLIF